MERTEIVARLGALAIAIASIDVAPPSSSVRLPLALAQFSQQAADAVSSEMTIRGEAQIELAFRSVGKDMT